MAILEFNQFRNKIQIKIRILFLVLKLNIIEVWKRYHFNTNSLKI